MRARYCAYAVGDVRYLVATTHPDGPMHRDDATSWRDELTSYCAETTFTGLVIHESSASDDGDAFVTFTAHLRRGGVDSSFTERSRFRRDGTRWKYFDGEDVTAPS